MKDDFDKDRVLEYIDILIEDSRFSIKDNNKYDKCIKSIFKLKKCIINDKLYKVQKKVNKNE